MLSLAVLWISAICTRRNRCRIVAKCTNGQWRNCTRFNPLSAVVLSLAVGGLWSSAAQAFIYNTGDDSMPIGMSGGLRWDSVPRMVGGTDRSLVGGISWNVDGSLAAFKSQFAWAGATPTDAQFLNTIEEAFSFWTSVDPNPLLNLAAPFSFVYSPDIAATDDPTTGEEIDLLASDLGFPGSAGGALSHPILNDHVTLTSGISDYGSDVIGGVDIFINNHVGTTWTLRRFRTLLAHEFGHSLGMGHASLGLSNRFVDDNYDGTSQSTANATLTNPDVHSLPPLWIPMASLFSRSKADRSRAANGPVHEIPI